MDISTIERVRTSVTEAEIAAFHRDGHLSLPPITSQDEVDVIRTLYDDLFAGRKGWEAGDLCDFAGVDDPSKTASVPQLLNPSKYAPYLAGTMFRQNALRIAKQLLGPTAELVFEHAMLKPPMTGGPTPWHQDESFYEYTNYKSITFWMPLQPVDVANGCMSFQSGSHKGVLLPHQSIGGDTRVHGLEAIGVDESIPSTLCALGCGEVSVHHALTLHKAGPNNSATPRRAYALGFGVRSRKFILKTEHPWNQAKATDRMRRSVEGLGAKDRAIVKFKTFAKAIRSRL